MDLQSLVARDHPLSRGTDVGVRAAGAFLFAIRGLAPGFPFPKAKHP